VVGQPRQTQRYEKTIRDDEHSLICDILSLARQFPRYGYRMIWSKLKQLGWQNLNVKRVYRIWRQEGLKVPKKKHKKRRLGDSSKSKSSKRSRRTFTKEFKQEAVQMVLDGHSPGSVSKNLGIGNTNLIYRWKADLIGESGPVAEALDDEVRQLREELQRTRRERTIKPN